MAIERDMLDWHGLRPALSQLNWGGGLTREEMMNQSPELRVPVMELLPGDFRFPNPGAVISYFEKLERDRGPELASLPPPEGYTPTSTTGITVAGHHYPPTVGGGYGSGNTGSSAQTGVNREGTLEHEAHT